MGCLECGGWCFCPYRLSPAIRDRIEGRSSCAQASACRRQRRLAVQGPDVGHGTPNQGVVAALRGQVRDLRDQEVPRGPHLPKTRFGDLLQDPPSRVCEHRCIDLSAWCGAQSAPPAFPGSVSRHDFVEEVVKEDQCMLFLFFGKGPGTL